MDKTEYLKQRNFIHAEQKRLDKDLQNIKAIYIRDNAKFKVGDTVRLNNSYGSNARPGRLAQVSAIGVDFGGDIYYRFLRTKKDGSVAKISDSCSRNELIEKL